MFEGGKAEEEEAMSDVTELLKNAIGSYEHSNQAVNIFSKALAKIKEMEALLKFVQEDRDELEAENRDLIEEKHPRYKTEDWQQLLKGHKLIQEKKNSQIKKLEAANSELLRQLLVKGDSNE